MSLSASDRLIFEGGEARLDGWALVALGGGHRERFLHSQLTSDVNALAVGASHQTALLDRTGRLQVFGFLHKRADRIDLLLPAEAVDSAVAMLEANVISDDVDVQRTDVRDLTLMLGAEAVRLASTLPGDATFPIQGWGSRGCVCWAAERPQLPEISGGELEVLRVLSGLPLWGVEASEGQLIHETSLLESAVSFDKGCYLGQETVAKVSSGRGAARGPVLLKVLEGEPVSADGVRGSFSAEGRDRAGEASAVVRWEGTTFVLASVVRGMRVEGTEQECRWSDGSLSRVRTMALPLLRTPEANEWATRIQLRAVDAFAADREDEAVRLLERAIAVCPSHADSYESLGVIFGRHHRYDEAISLMHRLLEVDPMSVMAHTNLSLYYNRQGKIEDAEREAGEALRAKMDLEHGQRECAEAERQQAAASAADRKRRAEMFRQVLALDPEDALGNFGLGELLAEEGRHDDAIVHLQKALRTDPRYSAAFAALGRAFEDSGHGETAVSTYREGIKIAAARGDLSTANKMQERLAVLKALDED